MRLNFEFPVLAKRTVDSVAVLVKTNLVLGYCPDHDCYLRRAVVSCARNKPSIKKVIYSRVAYMRPSGLHAVDSQKSYSCFHRAGLGLEREHLAVRSLDELAQVVLRYRTVPCGAYELSRRSGGCRSPAVAAQSVGHYGAQLHARR